ncbi:MAG: metal ABC transporter permease, partial [Deltaproteobacteria bacterium]|nr:metal ABC transporter permease [Deltaproteobacteria bacterium]
AYHYHHFVALSYDEEFAAVRGVPVKRLYFLLLIMTALTVVMVIQVVGLILVIALLTIPPFLAETTSRSLLRMMIFSSLLAVLFCSVGLGLAYRFNLTSGAAIIAVAGVVFFAVIAVRSLRRRTS